MHQKRPNIFSFYSILAGWSTWQWVFLNFSQNFRSFDTHDTPGCASAVIWNPLKQILAIPPTVRLQLQIWFFSHSLLSHFGYPLSHVCYSFRPLLLNMAGTMSDQRTFNLCRFLAMTEQRLHSTHFLHVKTSLLAFYWARAPVMIYMVFFLLWL